MDTKMIQKVGKIAGIALTGLVGGFGLGVGYGKKVDCCKTKTETEVVQVEEVKTKANK